METFDPLECSKYQRSSLYDPSKLINVLLARFSNIVARALDATKPMMEEAIAALAKLVSQYQDLSQSHRITRTWKPTGDPVRDLVRLLGVATADDLAKQLNSKFDSLRPTVSSLDKCGILGKRALTQWHLVAIFLRLVNLLTIILSILIAIAFDYFVSDLLQRYLQLVVPDIARILTIVILTVVTSILVDPFKAELINKVQWNFYERKCKQFTDLISQLRELLISLQP